MGDTKTEEVSSPDLVGLTIRDAKEKLKDLNLELEYEKLENEEIKESETVITDQLPKKGVKIREKNKVIVQIK